VAGVRPREGERRAPWVTGREVISERAVQEEVVTTGTAQQDPIVAVAQEIDQGTWQEADPRRD
jgi:hypothetical protein